MGHLKAHCPNKINKQYPFNDVLVSSMQIGVNRCPDKVCNSSLHVSKSQSDQLSVIDHIKGSSGRVQPGDVHVENAGQGYKMGKGPAVHSSAADNPGFVDSIDDGPETIELQRYWILDQGTSQIQDVQGRLKNKVSFWREVLQVPVPITDCIAEGYKLPLLSPPPTYAGKNQSSAHQNADFVSSAITELLQNHCVQRIPYKPHICSPLSVVSNNVGKLRLLLNLRYLNQFLLKDMKTLG